MTRSPFASALIPLVPLAAMAWPLHRAISREGYQHAPEEKVASLGPTRQADLAVRSAHPFLEITVRIGQAHWTFAPAEDLKEIHFPLDSSGDLHLTVTVVWPEETPESAVFLELTAAELGNRSATIWGLGEVTEELDFHWDLRE